jgi:signal peptide peptidase SppA
MSDKRYPHVVRLVSETPWALLPSTLASVLEMVSLRAAGHEFTEEEIQARIGAGPSRKGATMAGTVAVLPLYGVITPRADLMTDMSGGTSVQRFSDVFAAAVADQSVSAIVLDVDSPGGSTDMIAELAAEVRAARGSKPIVAVANTLAASAAYWIAAQADEIVVTPSGKVGSIGVLAAHDDISGLQAQAGVKTTLVTAGKFKAEGNPFEPLSEEALASIQGRVDEMYSMFVADVAKGRGVPRDTVRESYGQGRVLLAKPAFEAGMVDRIDTLQATVDRVGRAAKRQTTTTTTTTGTAQVSMTGTALGNAFAAGLATATTNEPPPPSGDTTEPDDQAASSGLSFAQEAAALLESATALKDRTASLAEVERGHLTVAKRERLTACTGELRDTVTALEGLLADTDPDKQRREVLGEIARYEARRHEMRSRTA